MKKLRITCCLACADDDAVEPSSRTEHRQEMHGANGLKNSAIVGNIGHFDNAVQRMQTMHGANGSQKMPTKNGLTMSTKNGLTMPTKNGLPRPTKNGPPASSPQRPAPW